MSGDVEYQGQQKKAQSHCEKALVRHGVPWHVPHRYLRNIASQRRCAFARVKYQLGLLPSGNRDHHGFTQGT